MNKLYFFSRSYEYMMPQKSDEYDLGEIAYTVFEDGEFYQRIITDVRGRDVVIVAGTISDTDTMELYDIAAGCAQYGARSAEIVIPFFGYSTMERAVKYGEIVKAKSRADLLSTIPRTSMGTKFYLLDLHAQGLPYYFSSDINTYHFDAVSVWGEWIRKQKKEDLVIGSTDAGRAKWVEKLAQLNDAEAAFIYKKRIQDGEVRLSAINANVKGKNVIIYDDMIRTGGSMIQAIKIYQSEGAESVTVISTHALMLKDSLDAILDLGVEKLVLTNSYPCRANLNRERVEVLDISPLLIHQISP